MNIPVLDHGFVRFVEAWGTGDAGDPEGGLAKRVRDYECGIIEAARQSTQGAFRGWEQDEKLLRYLFTHKPQHATPFEFSGMVIEVRAPIMVFREWHRHRTQSYNEMSARYAPLPDRNYNPDKDRLFLNSVTNKQAGTVKGAEVLDNMGASLWLQSLAELYDHAERVYQDGLRRGVPKEIARLAVTVGRYSQMRAQTNLRNWLAFLTLRADPDAQWEIRQFANAVGTIIADTFPRTWALYCEK